MKFIGEAFLRINRETVMRTLVESLNGSLIGNDLESVSMTYHSNGDVGLVVRNKRKDAVPLKAARPPSTVKGNADATS